MHDDIAPEAADDERDRLKRELLDIRAALSTTLRINRKESGGPLGHYLIAASDREILDEVHRLRRIADQHGDQ
jgi:hypothetical protein